MYRVIIVLLQNLLIAITLIAKAHSNEIERSNHLRRNSELTELKQKEAQDLQDLRKRMEPRTLLLEPAKKDSSANSSSHDKKHHWFWQKDTYDDDGVDSAVQDQDTETNALFSYDPPSQQFFHLHHMKTGGTSVSNWIDCGVRRFQKVYDIQFKQYKLSECSYNSYQKCISDDSASCRKKIASSHLMNYCAPLSVSDAMNWSKADAITMLRHPVDRVWSMYRFQTKTCFKCQNLTKVYQDIDEGNTEMYGGGVCLEQLMNHQMRNLQSTLTPTGELLPDMTEEDRIRDAIENIQNRFVVVGILERLEESIELFSYSFPWLAETLMGTNGEELEDAVKYKCPFPHENSSPSNNKCGEKNTHWDLSDHPDPETRRVIEEHNQLDIQVYEAAVRHFQRQVEAYSLQEDIE